MLALARADFGCLFDALHAEGYRVIGPTVRDGAIIYEEIAGPADLPIGWRDEQAPGRYRLVRRNDDACFGHVVGPHSWKQRLFPSREKLFQARRHPDGRVGFDPVLPDGPREAFLGVRACEVAAMEVQDRVFLGGPRAEPRYAARREGAFLVGVSCFEPGELCFCASMNTGPRVDHGVDLAMAELPGAFLFEAGTERGSAILDRLPTRPATAEELASFDEGIRKARGEMGRSVDPRGLPELLFGNLDHPRWAAVAQRCLSCGNCTSVCPTCFCSSAQEESDLTGHASTRVRTWDSCFTEEHAEIHGVNFRPVTRDRYRQWLTHKVGSWVSQFAVSGCVGCGRCIAWCPVGIDLTEEIAAIRVDASAPAPMPARRAPATATDDALVPRAAEVIAVTREAADVVTLHVVCDPPIAVAPGQFTMLSLPSLGEAAISISGTWGESIEQTIRDVGAVSGALAALRPGQQLGLRGPYGNGWPLDAARGRPVVVIAGGIGLAWIIHERAPVLRMRVAEHGRNVGNLVVSAGVRGVATPTTRSPRADDTLYTELPLRLPPAARARSDARRPTDLERRRAAAAPAARRTARPRGPRRGAAARSARPRACCPLPRRAGTPAPVPDRPGLRGSKRRRRASARSALAHVL